MIGDYVGFSIGSRAYGNIHIGNHVLVVPNSVVIKDVPDNCVVSGEPAKIIKQQRKMKIVLDPRNRIRYSAYYILGIEKLFGEKSVKFDMKPFTGLTRFREEHSFEQYMAFIIYDMDINRKYVIDFRDTEDISEMAYKWCDVYAKINISKETNMEEYPKMISIPPGFGIRIYSTVKIFYLCLLNLIKCRFKPLRGLYLHFIDYWSMYKYQLPISEYDSSSFDNDIICVFHASTLWSHKFCMSETNPLRLTFMEACKNNSNIQFEGGFFIKGEVPQRYKEFSFTSWIPRKDYLYKTKNSMFVFNTPAVHKCHGWKLGEYLAMAKVIITTPISNKLPSPLVNGENVIVVRNEVEMRDAIEVLAGDVKLREKISKNNREYYLKYVEPASVIKAMITKAQNNSK